MNKTTLQICVDGIHELLIMYHETTKKPARDVIIEFFKQTGWYIPELNRYTICSFQRR